MEFNDDYSKDFELFKYYRLCLYKKNVLNEDIIYEIDSKNNLIGHNCDFIIKSVEKWKQQDPTSFKNIEKDYFNLKARKHRCNYRIRYMLDKNIDNCYFMTFSFTDETLNRLNADSRRQYVRRYLSKYCSDYVANIDYGSKNEREHYHAIGIIKDLSILMPGKVENVFNMANYEKGFSSCIKIRNCADYTKLSSYINKITNHCFKDTTSKRLIYSRSFASDDFYITMLEYQYLDIEPSDIKDYASLIDYIDKRTRKMKQIKKVMKRKLNIGC